MKREQDQNIVLDLSGRSQSEDDMDNADNISDDVDSGMNHHLAQKIDQPEFKSKNIFNSEVKPPQRQFQDEIVQQAQQEELIALTPRSIKKKECVDGVLAMFPDRERFILEDLYDQTDGDQQMIIEILMSGEVPEQLQRQQRQRQEEQQLDPDEEYARKLQEKEMKQVRNQEMRIQQQLMLEEQMRNGRRSNGIRNVYEINGQNEQVFDSDDIENAAQRQSRRQNVPQSNSQLQPSSSSQPQKRSNGTQQQNGIKKNDNQQQQNQGIFAILCGCCVSSKPKRKQEDRQLQSREDKYMVNLDDESQLQQNNNAKI